MNRYRNHKRDNGFTLIEIVVTMLISVILALGIVTFISDTVDGVLASGNRNQLTSSGRTVVDRLALELHNAVPNSIRTTAAGAGGDQCIEFIPFEAATNYVDPPFTGSGGDEFEVIDFNPALTYASPAGVLAVIYPDDTDELYTGGTPGPRALVDAITDTGGADGKVTVYLDSTHRFSRRSPVDRIYIAMQPVSFCLEDNNLYRYQNYDFQATQCDPDTASCLPTSVPDRQLISDTIDNTGLAAFSILPATLRRNAIISMTLNFTSEGDVVQLKHEVMMRNVP
ncbi:MSHA biogenesis protein MshO [Pseudohongiella nitratireducens]|uniref:MSHA biogenesis protein MshO n=1 Tax=Pseudohongiella nitratireducens TaxID=1768907 RepID=A0A917GLI5_9GAMM|nr:prepilin-type N-terminal cleavage/methylation domain-containing protein [Pseudohongiella nitratireducens]GGG49925.1 MSHA biogenesis protein MshO [Pseudohongiella nitratireducens]